MIKTRDQALRILGLKLNATDAEIKAAYKDLVKRCHPDATGIDDASYYNLVIEAYEFLKKDILADGAKVVASRQPRVTPAGTVQGNSQFRRTGSASDYAAFERKIKKQQKQKAKDFDQKQKEYSAKLEKQDRDYKRVMEAVEAIRAARAIEAMVWANGLGKDKNATENREKQ